MSNVIKIRDLISNHPDDKRPVLNDLINSLVSLQAPLSKLEIYNYKESTKEAIKLLLEHEKLVSEFKYRLRNEVNVEVLEFLNNKPKRKGHKHPNSMKNLKFFKNK